MSDWLMSTDIVLTVAETSGAAPVVQQLEVCIFRAGNESCMELADNHAVCMHAAMDHYTAIKCNSLFKTCLVLFGSPLALLAPSKGWCLLTF